MLNKIKNYVRNPVHKDNVMLTLFVTIMLLCSSLFFMLGYGVRSVDLRYNIEVERIKFSQLALIALKQQEKLNAQGGIITLTDHIDTVEEFENFVEETCK